MSIALVYTRIDHEGEVEKISDRTHDFVMEHLPKSIESFTMVGDSEEWVGSPLLERPVGSELLTKIRNELCQHLVLGRLRDLFDHASVAADALGLLADSVPHLWSVEPFAHIQRGDTTSTLFRELRVLDTSITEMDRKREKAVAKRRRRGLRRPKDARSTYGFSVIVDKHGVSHVVEDTEERELMQWLIEQRDAGLEWNEIHTEAKRLRIKNRQGGPISVKGLMRRHQAALKLFEDQNATT